MAAFPGSVASFIGFVAGHSLLQDVHASQHNLEQAEIVATQTKLGTGASTPTAGVVLRGTGVGASAWGDLDLTTDVTGVLPVANGGTGFSDATSLKQQILGYVYPIGSIYANATSATNPGTLLGFGTWVAWGAGRVPVGFDSTQTEFDAAEETGGEKTHILTTAEMPAHTHNYADTRNLIVYAGGANASIDPSLGAFGTTTSSTGGGGAHNNLPPYIVTYLWKRVS